MCNCIFCKIIKGEIPSYKIYEDEKTLAFLDISEDIDGHTLVIPKVHCTNILDCPAEYLGSVMHTVQAVSKHYIECGYDGINLLNANNETAGQSVFHLHIHIIPRKAGDGEHTWPEFTGAKHTLGEMYDKLKMTK